MITQDFQNIMKNILAEHNPWKPINQELFLDNDKENSQILEMVAPQNLFKIHYFSR